MRIRRCQDNLGLPKISGSDLRFKHRKILSNNGPDDVQVHSEVIMHNPMPEPDDLAPFYFRLLRSERFRQTIGSLTDNFEVADQASAAMPEDTKRFRSKFSVVPNLSDGLKNILDQQRRGAFRHKRGHPLYFQTASA